MKVPGSAQFVAIGTPEKRSLLTVMELSAYAWFYTALAAFAVYACVYRWVIHRNFKGPKPWPIIGATLEIVVSRAQQELGDRMVRYSKLFYPTWKMRFPGVDYVVSVDPANVEYVLKTNFSNYPKGESQQTILYDVLGNGILNSDGDLWRRHRKVASHEFASKILRDNSSASFKVHAVSLCTILNQAADGNKPVDMMDLAIRLSLESVCKLAFGVDMGLLDPSLPETPFSKSFDAVTNRIADRYVDPLWKLGRFLGVGPEAAMKRNLKVVSSFAQKLVLTRKAELESTQQMRADLLSRFVEAVEKEPLSSDPVKDLEDVVTNFLLAARDTTASAVMWTLYAISSNLHVEEKIVEELLRLESENQAMAEDNSTEVSQSDDSHPRESFAHFVQLLSYGAVNHKMHYLQAAISEAMRLYPPVPGDVRVAIKDDILPACGTPIRAGDFFNLGAYIQGRMEQVWGEDCLQYKPERWLKDGVYQQESQFKYPVFLGGPRLCLGKDSALLHLKITLATLLRFFSFKLVPGHRVIPKFTVTLVMQYGLKMTVHKRL
ncbi:hypothetical protein R1sor_005349 [Riccia sorocarpa]|uniref:Cytochrome P450 n=1 Tax=Riccia sorocarpa TaxID=122646 RepID=A0ABD3HJA8_9MARC